MPITAKCSSCGFGGTVPDAYNGKTVRCRQCGTSFVAGSSLASSQTLGSLPPMVETGAILPALPDTTTPRLPPLPTAVSSGPQRPGQASSPRRTATVPPGPSAPLPASQSSKRFRVKLMCAGILLVLGIGVGGFSTYQFLANRDKISAVSNTSAPARVTESPSNLPPFVAEQAGAALLNSEAKIWALEGRSLKEAQELLASPDTRGLAIGAATRPIDKESLLRAHLRSKRSPASRQEGQLFIDTLNAKSKAFLSTTAAQMNMQAEDLVLEWLTYEGALDLGMMNMIWQGQGNFRREAAKEASALLDGVSDPPAADLGVQIESLTKNRIVVILFGAKVIEEIVTDQPARLEDGQVVIRWKSNYNYLRDVMRQEQPKAVMEEKIATDDGKYTIDYMDWFQEYLKGGHRQLWATQMYETSPLGVAQGARDEKLREELGQKSESTPSRKSLKEHFAKLSPSVPLIEAPGVGSGSGFLLLHEGKYVVITNRHVVANATQGLVVHFLSGRDQGTEAVFTVPASETAVIAIHRNADLAVIDVTRRAADLRKRGIEPLKLASAKHVPQVGEHVFAIGHPGAGDTGALLTRTLTDGIISAVGRTISSERSIQVTVPINPGNSGGPLFDDDGQIIGVNTFGFRMNKAENLALEALNFAVEVSHVRELLTDPAASFDAAGIADIIKPKLSVPAYVPPPDTANGITVVATRSFRVPIQRSSMFTITCSRKDTYFIAVSSKDDLTVNLAIYDSRGALTATAARVGPKPEMEFRVRKDGNHTVVINNPSSTRIPEVTVAVFKK
jgi:S1-C subfamily serine protease